MAAIQKRGAAQYRVRIRRAGVPEIITRTFESKDEAEKWARRIESEIDAGKRVLFLANAEARSMTLDQALERYRDEKMTYKTGADQERHRIARWLQRPLAKKMLHQILPGDLEKYRDERLAEGKAFSTVRQELNIISQVYEAARFSWRMRDLDNPMRHVLSSARRPGRSRATSASKARSACGRFSRRCRTTQSTRRQSITTRRGAASSRSSSPSRQAGAERILKGLWILFFAPWRTDLLLELHVPRLPAARNYELAVVAALRRKTSAGKRGRGRPPKVEKLRSAAVLEA